MNYTPEYFSSLVITNIPIKASELANALLPQIKAAWMADLIKNAPSLVVNSPCQFSIAFPNDKVINPPFTAKLVFTSKYNTRSEMKRVESIKGKSGMKK